MNAIDEKLVAAARAVADTVPEGSAPPLRLPASPAQSHRRNLRRLLAPVAAAAAIVVIGITTALVIRTGIGAGRSVAAGVSVGTWTPGPVPRIPAALERTLPRFYLTQWRPPHKKALRTAIAELRTGATIQITPPPGYQFFDWAAAVGDRTFALAAMENPPRNATYEQVVAFRPQVRLYLVGVGSSDGQVTVTELHARGLTLTDLAGIALSPDGSEVAVAQVRNALVRKPVSRITIYSRTGDLIRQWQSPGIVCYGYVGEQDFSWASNGNLAFTWGSGNAKTGIWVLDSDAPSGSIAGNARQAVPANVPDGFLAAPSFALTKGGTRIATGIQHRRPRPQPAIDVTYEFDQFSASTGKLVSKVTPRLRFYSDVLWSNESGSEQIVAGTMTPGAQHLALGILAGKRFVPFTGSPALAGAVAF